MLGVAGLFLIKTNKTFAENASTAIQVKLASVIAISADPTVNMQASPAPGGAFVKKTANVVVSTNNEAGYTLQIADKDSDTAMRHSALDTAKIDSINSNTTESNFAVNKWGLQLNATDFQKVPASGDPLTIPGTSNTAVANETKSVTFGTKIDTSLASGAYSDIVVFTAIANQVQNATFSGITTMQEMTPEICAAETVSDKEAEEVTTVHTDDANFIPQASLTDIRDGNTYLVRKIEEKCFMVQNLALSPNGTETYTEEDTDLHDGRTFSAPAATAWGNSGPYYAPWYTIPPADKAYIKDGSGDAGPTGAPEDSVGNYYNLTMAFASKDLGEATDKNKDGSICPKGWTLPKNNGGFAGMIIDNGLGFGGMPFNSVQAGFYNGYQANLVHFGERSYYITKNPVMIQQLWMLIKIFSCSLQEQSCNQTKGEPFHSTKAAPIRCIAQE